MGQKKGYKQTEEHKRKRLDSQNKYFENNPDCRKKEKHPLWGKNHSEKAKKNMSIAKKGNKKIAEHMNRIKFDWTGFKHTEETKEKIRLANLGEKNHAWKCGMKEKNARIWRSAKYQSWRRTILIRDDYICIGCGEENIKLEIHHIIPWRKEGFRHLVFELKNGVSLCPDCHKKSEFRLNGIKVEFLK